MGVSKFIFIWGSKFLNLGSIHGIGVIAFIGFLVPVFTLGQGTAEDIVNHRLEFNHSELPTYSTADGIAYNLQEYLDHPDFGTMTFTCPYGKNVVEDLSKRTADERYYVDLDDPLFFYIQKSSKPINTFEDGFWRAIDPSLRETSSNYFSSGIQPVPTALDVANKNSVLQLGDELVKFNSYEMIVTKNDGTVLTYEADWTTIDIGNFSIYITDVFPNVDMRMEYEEATVKSEFVIKENLNAKEIRFTDKLELDINLGILIDEEMHEAKGYVQVYNESTGETQAVFRPALTYDSSAGHETEWVSEYELDGTDLSVICDSIHLNNPSLEYPIVVDPTFVAVGPITSGFGLTGSLLSPAFCSTNLAVTFPGGSTPWDVSASWWVWTAGCSSSFWSCWMSEAQVWITSSCGGASPVGAPGIVWICPGCNSPGSWTPTIPFNSSGTQSLAQCYLPQCANQIQTYTINLNRAWCTGAGGSDNCNWFTSSCQSMDQWQVTVQGRSVETLGNTATGNGSQTLNDPDCIGTFTLDPTPLYGVPGYTYLWSTTETTPTIVVPVAPGVYTCDVTDACGTTVTATFTIGCPLDNEEMEFTAEAIDQYVKLEWHETAVEIDHYVIERSGNDGVFEAMETMPAAESVTGEFRWYDGQPLAGNNFYRVKLLHKSGLEEYSPIEMVEIIPQADELVLIPNPSAGSFSINLNSESVKPYEIIVRDVAGRTVHKQLISNHDEMELPELEDGVYLIAAYQNRTLIDQQRLILKK
jgi:hypothetical protein